MSDQMSLTTVWVDLSPEELADKGRALADAVRDLTLLDEEHAERKKEMAKDRKAHVAKAARAGLRGESCEGREADRSMTRPHPQRPAEAWA